MLPSLVDGCKDVFEAKTRSTLLPNIMDMFVVVFRRSINGKKSIVKVSNKAVGNHRCG